MSRLKEIINQRSMIKNLYKRTGICPTLLAVLSPQMIKKLHALSYCSNARRKLIDIGEEDDVIDFDNDVFGECYLHSKNRNAFKAADDSTVQGSTGVGILSGVACILSSAILTPSVGPLGLISIGVGALILAPSSVSAYRNSKVVKQEKNKAARKLAEPYIEKFNKIIEENQESLATSQLENV